MFKKDIQTNTQNLSLSELKQLRERFITKMMILGLEVIGFFGIPAVIGVLIIKSQNITGPIRFIIFGVAFAISWILFLRRVRVMSTHIKNVETRITELLKEESHDTVDAATNEGKEQITK